MACWLFCRREPVNDPHVLAIKQTIYRTGADPQMLDLLREAVRREQRGAGGGRAQSAL